MPRLWPVRDGPDPTRGFGHELSFEQLANVARDFEVEFVSAEPPHFNVESPSWYPSRIVVEVGPEETRHCPYHDGGFYVIAGLGLLQAGERLRDLGVVD